MPLVLIEGHYEVVGAAPDGDSVKFYPGKKTDWKLVRGRAVRSNLRGGAQLRLDAIDALETHYTPPHSPFGTTHQPKDGAQSAANAALEWLGFRDVTRGPNEIVSDAKPKQVPGYIFTRFADTYGRCVAFAFKGKHRGQTGDELFFDEATLQNSLNYFLLAEGHAYPTYYSQLYVDLRRALTKAADSARHARKGVWAKDKTTSGYEVPEQLSALQSTAYILPKLYRRLIDYVALNGGDTSLEGFEAYLGERDDRLFVLSEGQKTGFDTVVATEGQTVRLTKPVDDLVFEEK